VTAYDFLRKPPIYSLRIRIEWRNIFSYRPQRIACLVFLDDL